MYLEISPSRNFTVSNANLLKLNRVLQWNTSKKNNWKMVTDMWLSMYKWLSICWQNRSNSVRVMFFNVKHGWRFHISNIFAFPNCTLMNTRRNFKIWSFTKFIEQKVGDFLITEIIALWKKTRFPFKYTGCFWNF